MKVVSLDTRQLRNMHGLWTAGKRQAVCNLCAKVDACDLVEETMLHCDLYMPFIGFTPPLLGFEGRFNTFRLGEAWFNRLASHKSPVAIVDTSTKKLFGLTRVTALDRGTMRDMLDAHAHSNHLMLKETREDAPEKLHAAILRMYGPRLVTLDRPTTVIFMERIKRAQDEA